jgi:hypothetical protein
VKPEISHLVKLIKQYHPHWANKSYKDIENAILWYALHGGIIYVSSLKGEALLLARRLDDIGSRIDGNAFDPDGSILWVELFYQTHYEAALDLLSRATDRWKECKFLAFHKSKDEAPASYRIYDKEFVIRYLGNLYSNFKE